MNITAVCGIFARDHKLRYIYGTPTIFAAAKWSIVNKNIGANVIFQSVVRTRFIDECKLIAESRYEKARFVM